MEQNFCQINGGLTINKDVNIKKLKMCVKKITFGTLLHVVLKMENI